MSNEFQTGASISKRTKASSLMDSPLERPPGDNSLESNVEYEAKSSLKEETNNDLEVGSVLVENPLKSDVDVESVQNNATLGVKKKKKRKKKKKHNALEDSSVHNDLEEGSLFVKNLSPLKREVDVETAQNNETLVCKKKKKRNKQEKGLKALEDSNVHNKLENGSSLVDNHPPLERDSSLQPPFNCLEMDTEMADNSLKSDVEYEAKSNLKKETKKRNKLKRKHDASILGDQVDNQLQKDLETSQNNPALDRKPRKKRKNRKKKLNDASENCNVHNDREEDSVLAGNPPLKSDVDVESVQNNATLGVKKRKRKKNKNKKHNPLEDSSVHNDLEEGSLVENLSPLKRDVDVETAQNNEALVCKKKKKRNRPKKRPKASEDSNIHNELENGSSLVENPPPLQHPFNCLKMDTEMIDYTSKVSLHDGKKRQESIESNIDRMKEASVTCADGQPASGENKSRMKAERVDEIGNIYSIREDVSVLSNPMDRLEHTNMDRQEKIQIEVQDAVHVEKVLSEFTDNENFFNEPSGCDPSCKFLEQKNVLMEIIEEKNLSFSNLGPIEVDVDLLINNKDNPPRVLISSPERALSGHSRKKLLILDVNGLLADIVQRATSGYKPDTTIYGKKVFKRPFCEDFLQFCLERFDVGVWSSRKKKNVYRVLNFLMGNSIGKLLFCWDQTHCTRTKFKTLEDRNKPLVLKELRKLWEKRENYGEYNESNTLLLDDSPYKALRNPAHTAVFPNTYHYYYTQDCSLGPKGDLRVYLEGLATSENVQDYVKQNPFGQRPITESSLTWGFYSKIASVSSQQHNITKAHSPAVTYKKTKKKHSPAVTYKKKKKKFPCRVTDVER